MNAYNEGIDGYNDPDTDEPIMGTGVAVAPPAGDPVQDRVQELKADALREAGLEPTTLTEEAEEATEEFVYTPPEGEELTIGDFEVTQYTFTSADQFDSWQNGSHADTECFIVRTWLDDPALSNGRIDKEGDFRTASDVEALKASGDHPLKYDIFGHMNFDAPYESYVDLTDFNWDDEFAWDNYGKTLAEYEDGTLILERNDDYEDPFNQCSVAVIYNGKSISPKTYADTLARIEADRKAREEMKAKALEIAQKRPEFPIYNDGYVTFRGTNDLMDGKLTERWRLTHRVGVPISEDERKDLIGKIQKIKTESDMVAAELKATTDELKGKMKVLGHTMERLQNQFVSGMRLTPVSCLIYYNIDDDASCRLVAPATGEVIYEGKYGHGTVVEQINRWSNPLKSQMIDEQDMVG